MTTFRLDMLRVTAAPLIVLATTVGILGHGVLGDSSSAAVGAASARLVHNGAIAFVSYPGGHPSLAAIKPDGTGFRRITRPCTLRACIIREYRWSPDGRRIAFLRGREGGMKTPSNLSLFVVNADGTGEKRLAGCAGACDAFYGGSHLSWSPDGTRIVFSRGWSLYIVNASTGRLSALTRCSSSCSDMMPAWAPDGARIVFIRNSSVYIVNVDGSGLRRLSVFGNTESPVWSPDARIIAFNNSRGEIAIIHPDGFHLQVLTHFSGTLATAPENPVWSPDGRLIVFFRTPGLPGAYTGELWVMNANGSHLRRLYRQHVPLTGGDGPDWSPDGRYIAFLGYHTVYPWQLYVMDADGSHLRLLRTGASEPEWQPVP